MENTKTYSGLFIITPDKEASIDALKEDIGAVISENSGEISETKLIGKKRLAYPINKKTEGIYLEVLFIAPTKAIAKLVRQFQINTDILRTLVNVAG